MSLNIPPESYIKESEARLETLYEKLSQFEDEKNRTADPPRKFQLEKEIEALSGEIEKLESDIQTWRGERAKLTPDDANRSSLFLLFAIDSQSSKAKSFKLEAWRCENEANWKKFDLPNAYQPISDEYQPISAVRAKIEELISYEYNWGEPEFSVEIILPDSLFFSDFRKLSIRDKKGNALGPVMESKPFVVRWFERFSWRRENDNHAPWREKSKRTSHNAPHKNHIIFEDSKECFDSDFLRKRIVPTDTGICVGFGFKPKSSKHLRSILATGTPVALWPLRDLRPDEVAELKSLPQPGRLKTLPKVLQERRYQAMCERCENHWSHSVVLLYDDYDRIPPGDDEPFSSLA
jgi:hypothetical protein